MRYRPVAVLAIAILLPVSGSAQVQQDRPSYHLVPSGQLLLMSTVIDKQRQLIREQAQLIAAQERELERSRQQCTGGRVGI